MATRMDSRQSRQRTVLDQLSDSTNLRLDQLLNLVNDELTPPCRLKASSVADRILHIDPAVVQTIDGAEGTQRNKVPTPIGSDHQVITAFTGGTVEFPATPGGTVTVSPGSNVTFPSIASGTKVQCLISINGSGNIVVTFGTENAAEESMRLPAPTDNTYAIGYAVISNTAGVLSNVTNDKIFTFGVTGYNAGVTFGGEPGSVSSSTSGQAGTATTVSRSDHNHDLGTHTHADASTGGTISHTALTDKGTLTHSTIDGYLNQAVQTTSSPSFVTITGTTSLITPIVKAYDGNGIKFQKNNGTEVGSVDDTGIWTIGAASGALAHIIQSGEITSLTLKSGSSSYSSSLKFAQGSTTKWSLIVPSGSNPTFSLYSEAISQSVAVCGYTGNWTFGANSGNGDHIFTSGGDTLVHIQATDNINNEPILYFSRYNTNLWKIYSPSGVTDLSVYSPTGSIETARCTNAGDWKFGATTGGVRHFVNGSLTVDGKSGGGSDKSGVIGAEAAIAIGGNITNYNSNDRYIYDGRASSFIAYRAANDTGISFKWLTWPNGSSGNYLGQDGAATEAGSISQDAKWVIGASGGTKTHEINGNLSITGTISGITLPGLVPVGGVLASFPHLTGAYDCTNTTADTDGSGYVVCAGQTINDATSPMHGAVIPNINNDVFLAGNTTAGTAGGANTKDLSHTHNFTGNAVASGNQSVSTTTRTTNVAADMPAHYHGIGTGAGLTAAAQTFTPTGSGVTGGESSHTHSMSFTSGAEASHTHAMSFTSGAEAAHTHSMSFTSGSQSVDHRHDMTHSHTSTTSGGSGAHTHAMTAPVYGGYVHSDGLHDTMGSDQPRSNIGSSNGSYHWYTSNPGNHTHSTSTPSYSGNTGYISSGHTHTVAGTSAAGASHTHTVAGTSAAGASHTHAVSGTSAAGSSHTHTFGGANSSSSVSGTVGLVTGGVNGNTAQALSFTQPTFTVDNHTHTTTSTGSNSSSLSSSFDVRPSYITTRYIMRIK